VTVIYDGAKVSYVGMTGPDNPEIGDAGTVLSATAAYAHVQWRTGRRLGQVDLVHSADLVAGEPVVDPMENDLSMSAPERRVAVRELLDCGPSAVLAALSEAGVLASLAAAAEQASEDLTARLHGDPILGQALAGADPEDRQQVLAILGPYLLRQACGG
jgi:hypothetical protein